jgi:hypothetical protein
MSPSWGPTILRESLSCNGEAPSCVHQSTVWCSATQLETSIAGV